jgi:hypothetical protein
MIKKGKKTNSNNINTKNKNTEKHIKDDVLRESTDNNQQYIMI